MSTDYEVHVVSNTHWDREWLYDFQETRMMLVEMIDKLLDVLEQEPGYASFLMDSQSVPLEDYLEIRPEARERVTKHVSDGRLLVGPWYTCPEAFNVLGESLLRNLLYGHRVARSFGHVMKVGHTPFSYGQNSQLPQIYRGFDIDTMLFYHGVSHDEVPNEFIFEGADGTQILGSQMSSGARYNFYFHVYRPVVFGTKQHERMYAWEKGGLPFRLCREEQSTDHHVLLDVPRNPFDAQTAVECVDRLREMEQNVATTPYLAFMMGHDSSVPDPVTLRIVEAAQQVLPRGAISHSSLPALMDKVKKAAKNLVVLKGERRTPKFMDGRIHLYSDVLSSRTRMKRLNAQAESALQRWAEPYAAVAWCLGTAYPASYLDLAWKTLLKCHAHDSIAGSGVDEIERDMTYRLRQVINIADGVTRRSLAQVQSRIDHSDAAPDDVLLTVFNASPRVRSEVVTVVLDVPRHTATPQFAFIDAENGAAAAVQMVTRKPHHAVMNHDGDATAMMESEQVTCHVELNDVPALGYASYRLDRKGTFARGGLATGHNTLENEHLRVEISPQGTLNVVHKSTGARFDGLHYFEDSAEAGHAWMHIEPAIDEILTSPGFPTEIALLENGPLLGRYRIACRMRVPAGLDENGGNPWQRLDGAGSAAHRSSELRELTIVSTVTLRKGANAIEVTTRFTNTAENHRLRVMFPTRLQAKTCHVESPFDVVERDVVFGPDSPWFGSVNATFPMLRFVDVNDGKAGLAIINDGLREYQVTDDDDRTIAVTLMRAYQVSLTTVSKRWDVRPQMGLSQCPGEHEFRYLIYPHAGSWDAADVYANVERLAAPLQPAQAGPHGGALPKRCSFLQVEPANLILSAVKQSESGEGLVIRVFNPTAHAIEGKLRFFRPLRTAHALTLEEKRGEPLTVQDDTISFPAGMKKIVTLEITF